jgi:hypothetical protein
VQRERIAPKPWDLLLEQLRKIVHLGHPPRFRWPQQSKARLLSTASPTIAPAAAQSAATTDESDDEQQHDGADRGIDDCADNSDTKMNADLRQQPVTDEGADNSDHKVTNQPETGTIDDFTGEPPGNDTNQQYDKETFIRHVHGGALRAACLAFRIALAG